MAEEQVRTVLPGPLRPYKPGQGVYVRRAALAMLLLLDFFGCFELYVRAMPHKEGEDASSWWEVSLTSAKVLGRTIEINRWLILCGGVFAVVAAAVWWGLNRPKIGEFLIETEGEMRRVSWPARREYLNASTVVLFITVGLSVLVYLMDVGLSWLMDRLGGF